MTHRYPANALRRITRGGDGASGVAPPKATVDEPDPYEILGIRRAATGEGSGKTMPKTNASSGAR